jgi:hypothetical protein
MIIRIMGQGQYEVKSILFDDLNAIDNKIVEYVHKGEETEYKKSLTELIGLIVRQGKKVPDSEIVESSIIVPPADMTLEEARQVFTGEGIFEG